MILLRENRVIYIYAAQRSVTASVRY